MDTNICKKLDAQHPALGDTLQAMMSLPSSMNKPLIAISLVTERSLVIQVGALALKFDRETPKNPELSRSVVNCAFAIKARDMRIAEDHARPGRDSGGWIDSRTKVGGQTCHDQKPFHFHHWPSSFHLLHACLLQSPHLVMAIKSPPSGHHSALLRARSIDCFKYQTKRQLKKHGMGRLARSAKRNDRATAVLQGSSEDLLLQWTPIYAKNSMHNTPL